MLITLRRYINVHLTLTLTVTLSVISETSFVPKTTYARRLGVRREIVQKFAIKWCALRDFFAFLALLCVCMHWKLELDGKIKRNQTEKPLNDGKSVCLCAWQSSLRWCWTSDDVARCWLLSAAARPTPRDFRRRMRSLSQPQCRSPFSSAIRSTSLDRAV